MPEPKEHDILCANEASEISYRQVLAEFKEDIFPAFADNGVPLESALVFYQLVCMENRLNEVIRLLEDKIT